MRTETESVTIMARMAADAAVVADADVEEAEAGGSSPQRMDSVSGA